MSYDPRKRIDELRIEKGWTRAKLAHKIGISVTSVYNWYNEKNSMPTIPILEDVCLVLDTSMVYLFTDSDSEKDELNANQITLLELFNKLSIKQQENVIEILRNIVSAQSSK